MDLMTISLAIGFLSAVVCVIAALPDLLRIHTIDAFISYRDSTKYIAKLIASMLREKGFSTWFFPEEISPGDRHRDVIDSALKRSKSLVILIDSHSLRKGQDYELKMASSLAMRILPVAIWRNRQEQGALYTNEDLDDMQWIIFEEPFRDYERIIDELVRGIEGGRHNYKQSDFQSKEQDQQ